MSCRSPLRGLADGSPPTRRRLRRVAIAALLSCSALTARGLAHEGHQHDDGGTGIAVPGLLFALGGVLVATGLALDRSGEVPRQYVDGLVLGGAALLLVVSPLLWLL